MPDQLSVAEYRLLHAPKAPGKATTAAGGRASTTRQKTDTHAAILRPRYAVATFAGYHGLRFVAHGLTPQQVQGLREACQVLGILPA